MRVEEEESKISTEGKIYMRTDEVYIEHYITKIETSCPNQRQTDYYAIHSVAIFHADSHGQIHLLDSVTSSGEHSRATVSPSMVRRTPNLHTPAYTSASKFNVTGTDNYLN